MHLAVFVDRDIFAFDETFVCEVKSDLVGHARVPVIVGRPAAAQVVNEVTEEIVLTRPQPRHPAGIAKRAPKHRIDPTIFVQWGDDGIGDVHIALAMATLTRKLQVNLPKLRWQRGAQDRFEIRGSHGYRSLTLDWRFKRPVMHPALRRPSRASSGI